MYETYKLSNEEGEKNGHSVQKKVDIYIVKVSIWKVLEYNERVIRYASRTRDIGITPLYVTFESFSLTQPSNCDPALKCVLIMSSIFACAVENTDLVLRGRTVELRELEAPTIFGETPTHPRAVSSTHL